MIDRRTPHLLPRAATTAVVAAAALLLAACGSSSESTAADDTAADNRADNRAEGGGRSVTVYTGRHYGIEPVFDAFTAATGIEVRFVAGKDPELRERLTVEGANTPADVIMTADAANIELAAKAGLLASVDSEALTEAIPPELRSDDQNWFSLSKRARVIVASEDRVTEPPTTYAALGDPTWKGRLCLRPSTHPYTQSLVASMIVAEGEERAEAIVSSWVANDPLYIDSDTDIYKAVADGECDVAIANSYYLARLLAEDPNFAAELVWPEQDGRGAHINVSTAAVTADAPNPQGALALIEWLATDGQKQFADANFEYPANPAIDPDPIVAGFGPFTADVAVVRELGANQPAAVELLSRAGYE